MLYPKMKERINIKLNNKGIYTIYNYINKGLYSGGKSGGKSLSKWI